MKDKKRVLFVAHVDSHIQAFHIPFLKLFKDSNYIVDVASNGNRKFKYCDHKYNLPFQRTPLSLYNLTAYYQLKKILNENSYDIIHCHTPTGGFVTRLANKNCNYYRNTKIIYTAHGFHFFNNNNFLKNILFKNVERYVAKYTDILITINQEDYDASQQFKLKSNGKTFLVPGVGIDLDCIRQVQYDRNSLLTSLNIPLASKLLLSVGELNTNKNHTVVLKALKNIPHNFHYIICGTGNNKINIVEEIHRLGLADRVHILGYKENVYEIMKCCDFFLFPSKREGLSVALMEAMACEMVCIVSNVRGNKDLIDNHLGGYTLDVDKFASELPSTLLQKDDIYNKMIDYNKKRLNQYSIDTILEKMRNIYGLEQ